jgi:hypothetical protein
MSFGKKPGSDSDLDWKLLPHPEQKCGLISRNPRNLHTKGFHIKPMTHKNTANKMLTYCAELLLLLAKCAASVPSSCRRLASWFLFLFAWNWTVCSFVEQYFQRFLVAGVHSSHSCRLVTIPQSLVRPW